MSEPITVDERYTSAIHASNLRCETRDGAPINAADVLIAVGWSPSRLGAALMRLHSEYDGVAKPRPVCHEGLVRMALKHKGTQKERETLAQIEAANWLQNEKALFLGKLKALPAVIEQITIQSVKWEISNPIGFARVSVGHWLNQLCDKCHGVKFELIPNTPSTSAKTCNACNGIGLSVTPYGGDGRRMANYMDYCVEMGRRSIKQRLQNNFK